MVKSPFFDSSLSFHVSHFVTQKLYFTTFSFYVIFCIVLSPVRAQTAQNERKTEMESESESRTYFVVAGREASHARTGLLHTLNAPTCFSSRFDLNPGSRECLESKV